MSSFEIPDFAKEFMESMEDPLAGISDPPTGVSSPEGANDRRVHLLIKKEPQDDFGVTAYNKGKTEGGSRLRPPPLPEKEIEGIVLPIGVPQPPLELPERTAVFDVVATKIPLSQRFKGLSDKVAAEARVLPKAKVDDSSNVQERKILRSGNASRRLTFEVQVDDSSDVQEMRILRSGNASYRSTLKKGPIQIGRGGCVQGGRIEKKRTEKFAKFGKKNIESPKKSPTKEELDSELDNLMSRSKESPTKNCDDKKAFAPIEAPVEFELDASILDQELEMYMREGQMLRASAGPDPLAIVMDFNEDLLEV